MKESHYPTVRPAADIMAVEDGVQIVANMPGVRPEDLHFALEGRRLHIEASSRCPCPMTGGRDLRNLEFGNVEYELDVAMEAPLSSLPSVSLDSGVLSIYLPAEARDKVRVV